MSKTESRTECQRCGRAALGGDGNPEARIMRRSQQGVCVDCATVIFLQRLDNMHGSKMHGHLLPPGETWATALCLPHVQEQFAAVMKAGKADANADEIDWNRVIELWDIVPKEEGGLW